MKINKLFIAICIACVAPLISGGAMQKPLGVMESYAAQSQLPGQITVTGYVL